MNTKHTPGPWKIFEYPNRHGGLSIEKADESSLLRIADTWAMGEILDDETQANAHLIAAAPELLCALETLLDNFEHVARNDPHMAEQGYGSEVLPTIFSQARAAIAKAKGYKP